MIRRIISAIILVSMLVALTGCQTVQGIGKDITWLGREWSDDSPEVSEY